MSCERFRSAARARACPRGDIELVRHRETGVVTNRLFDPATQRFTADYEETQSFSPHFSAYTQDAVARLAERHRLGGKRVLEIGCGKGDFLIALARASGATCIGIDPSYRAGRHDRSGLDITFHAELLGPGHHDLAPDLVICRHTLEHIGDLHDFLGHIAAIMAGRPGAVLYADVPDAGAVFRDGAFWDVYYEHCHYFTPASFAAVLQRAGFAVDDVCGEYDGQFICAEARLGGAGADAASAAGPDAASGFAAAVCDQLAAWRAWFEARPGRRVCLWGGGSKAVGFLAAQGFAESVCGIVDINPHKTGTFAPGSGIAISGPESLPDLDPDDIVVMNPVYASEIAGMMRERGIGATLWALGGLPIEPVATTEPLAAPG